MNRPNSFQGMTPKEKINYLLQTMPDELKREAEAIGDEFSSLQWKAGSLANKIYSWVVAENLPFTLQTCCIAATIMIDAGPEFGQYVVENYARAAAFYSSLGDDVNPDFFKLPFSHFEYAIEYAGRKGSRKYFKDVLNYSLKQAGDSRKITERALRAVFEPERSSHDEPTAMRIEYERPEQSERTSINQVLQSGMRLDFILNALSMLMRSWSKNEPHKARWIGVIHQMLIMLNETPEDELEEFSIEQLTKQISRL